jgi:subtilisin family serine protease
MEMVRYVILRRPPGHALDDFGTTSNRLTPDAAIDATISVETLPSSAIADVERDPSTIAAAPEMPTSLIEPMASSAPDLSEDWGISAVGADKSQYDGSGVNVAILDTGIDRKHPAFAKTTLTEKDFTGTGTDDGHGHGTHCAGTVFGQDVNGRIGVARGISKALIGKVLDKDGRGTAEMAYQGLLWAAESGANIISMSIGFDVPGIVASLEKSGWPTELAASVALESFRKNLRLFDSVMNLLRARRDFGREVLVIAAAGNASRRQQEERFKIAASLPAAADDVVSVGALGRSGGGLKIADFSNTMPTLSGPGVGIRSAWLGGGTKVLNGTSMACPHVAGVAALWWQSLNHASSAETIRAKLIATADLKSLTGVYDRNDVGAGLVKAP